MRSNNILYFTTALALSTSLLSTSVYGSDKTEKKLENEKRPSIQPRSPDEKKGSKSLNEPTLHSMLPKDLIPTIPQGSLKGNVLESIYTKKYNESTKYTIRCGLPGFLTAEELIDMGLTKCAHEDIPYSELRGALHAKLKTKLAFNNIIFLTPLQLNELNELTEKTKEANTKDFPKDEKTKFLKKAFNNDLSKEELSKVWSDEELIKKLHLHIIDRELKNKGLITDKHTLAAVLYNGELRAIEIKNLIAVQFEPSHRKSATEMKDPAISDEADLVSYLLCKSAQNGLEPMFFDKEYLGKSYKNPLEFTVNFHLQKPQKSKNVVEESKNVNSTTVTTNFGAMSYMEAQIVEKSLLQHLDPSMDPHFLQTIPEIKYQRHAVELGHPKFLTPKDLKKMKILSNSSTFNPLSYSDIRKRTITVGIKSITTGIEIQNPENLVAVLYNKEPRNQGTNMKTKHKKREYGEEADIVTYILCEKVGKVLEPLLYKDTYLDKDCLRPIKLSVSTHYRMNKDPSSSQTKGKGSKNAQSRPVQLPEKIVFPDEESDPE